MRFALGLIEWLCLFINQRLLHYLPARPLVETSITLFLDLLPDIPLWMKNPDYERVSGLAWLLRFISYMWPYLDKVVCKIIRSSAQPILQITLALSVLSSMRPTRRSFCLNLQSSGQAIPILFWCQKHKLRMVV
ncbi:hypothetical protein Bca4012_072919 [Brassica carinata]